MTLQADTDLLERLEAMNLDVAGASLPFSRRLARDNGWSVEFSQRVVNEYKRFVYLAMTAGHPVTPSDEVDQAWHLHLAYTRHYWDEMCGEILKQPLHHGPTLGGRAESAKYADWYTRTLEAYAAAFGHQPPVDIWPTPEQRFSAVEGFRRVNTADLLMVPVSRIQAAGAGSLALILAGCSLDGEFGWGEVFLVFALLAVGAAWFARKKRKRKRRKGGSSAAAGGCGASGCGSGKVGDDGGSGCGGDSGCGGGCGGCGG